jgi:hypothetical protein
MSRPSPRGFPVSPEKPRENHSLSDPRISPRRVKVLSRVAFVRRIDGTETSAGVGGDDTVARAGASAD